MRIFKNTQELQNIRVLPTCVLKNFNRAAPYFKNIICIRDLCIQVSTTVSLRVNVTNAHVCVYVDMQVQGTLLVMFGLMHACTR